MSQSDYIEIMIPLLPPGINQTYQIIKRSTKNGTAPGLALTKKARSWDKGAALIIGATAGQFEFEPNLTANYQIVIRWWGGRHDTDAHLKLVQDCVSRKLHFDDRQIKSCVIERCPPDWGEENDEPEGVLVHLFRALERDWISSLLCERMELEND